MLDFVLWASHTTFKEDGGMTRFSLVYGTEALIPMEFIVGSLRTSVDGCISQVQGMEKE